MKIPVAKRIDLVGKIFGRLKVIRFLGNIRDSKKQSRPIWECRCECGKICSVQSSALLSKNKRSCGCMKSPREESSLIRLIYQMKANAESRNLLWDLSDNLVKFLTKQNCYYCDVRPRQVIISSKNAAPYTYNGIDRLNNLKDYTGDNVVPCCKKCNMGKGVRDRVKFIEWVKRVYHYSKLYRGG